MPSRSTPSLSTFATHPHPMFPLLFLLLSLLSLFLLPSPTLASPSPTDRVSASLLFDFSGPTIPPNFASFSVEPYALFDWTGRHPAPVNPAFIRLLSSLHPTPHSPGPTLRIGGNSADMASYNPHHTTRPTPPYGRSLWYDITDNDLQSMAAAARAINGSLVLGVNFRTPGDAAVAVAHLQAVERVVGWELVEAIEIGNEPDVYEWTQLRPSGYDLTAYTDEWLHYARALHIALPDMPEPIFQGGAFGSLSWAGQWHRFMSRARNFLKSLSFHQYPLSLCQGGTPTVHRLLSDQSSQGAARALMRSQAVSHVQGYGLPLVVSEGSSVSCGRMPGVSNSYAAALWAIDEMLVDASIGIRSWHFHYAGGNTTTTYSPLVKQTLGRGAASGTALTVMPIFYALRFFALATVNASTIYRVNVTDSSNPHVKVYSLITKEGNVQVVLLHKDASTRLDATVTLRLTLPVAFSTLPYASVLRMTAPSATSVSGVRLGGQTYDGSVDGEPLGHTEREYIRPVDGAYELHVARLSAVLLTMHVDGPYHMDDQPATSIAEDGSAVGLGDSWQQQGEAELSELEGEPTFPLTELPGEGESATAGVLHEDGAIATMVDSGAGSSAPRRVVGGKRVEGEWVGDARTWRARRGKFALSDAKAQYEQLMEQQVAEHVHRSISDMKGRRA